MIWLRKFWLNVKYDERAGANQNGAQDKSMLYIGATERQIRRKMVFLQ